jgi:hypothetical protein
MSALADLPELVGFFAIGHGARRGDALRAP